MSTANHRPGPWRQHPLRPGIIYTEKWEMVAGLSGHQVGAERQAIVDLMTAAPELRTALELFQGSNGCFGGCYGISDWRHSGDCATARAAIAKARGQNV